MKYRIYYGIGSGKRTKIEVGNVVSATLKGLVPDTKYSVDIAALKSNGTRSAYSSRIAISTDDLDRPTDLEVTHQTQSSATLIWDKERGVPKCRLTYGIGDG